VVFTPRHGKPVEINALWYHCLCALAERVDGYASQRADYFRDLASKVQQAFGPTFWHDRFHCLYDVVRGHWRDMSIRPNQIFAVSLPHSPLDESQKQAVLECVERELLTPYGLRSLAPSHPSYRGRYEGGPFERDSVYHQGTVWAWLIGPYVEAYLRVHNFSADAKARMRQQLLPLVEHLDEAGIGYVSEILDGDAPHTPRGCIAQAWSVAELLRAWRMTES
jgi:predicted glycogen debranching enzyme